MPRIDYLCKKMSATNDTPSFWYFSKPLNSRRFHPHLRVKPTGHRLVDDGLLLLVEQLDKPLLGADEAVDEEIDMGEVADDSCLFVKVRDCNKHIPDESPFCPWHFCTIG